MTSTHKNGQDRLKRNPRGIYEHPPGSGIWWIHYFDAERRRHREKAGPKGIAIKLYRKRKQEALEGRKLPELRRRRVTFGELAQDALAYRRQQSKSPTDKQRMGRLLDWWKNTPAESLTPGEIERRLSRPEWSNATFNRYRAMISLTYRIGIRRGKVSVNPARIIPARRESPARQGFVDDKQYSKLAGLCSTLWMRALLSLSYTYGWRKGELLGLRVRQVNLLDRTVRLEPGTTKNSEGRSVQLTAECYELVCACIERKAADDYAFTREDGTPVKDFSKTWADLCVAAGLGEFICRTCKTPGRPCPACAKAKRRTSYAYHGLIFHDLRRSAVRNLERAGIPRSVSMKITGHKTEAVYRRYAIVSPADLAEATRRLEQSRLNSQTERPSEQPPASSARAADSAKLN